MTALIAWHGARWNISSPRIRGVCAVEKVTMAAWYLRTCCNGVFHINRSGPSVALPRNQPWMFRFFHIVVCCFCLSGFTGWHILGSRGSLVGVDPTSPRCGTHATAIEKVLGTSTIPTICWPCGWFQMLGCCARMTVFLGGGWAGKSLPSTQKSTRSPLNLCFILWWNLDILKH